MISKKIRKFLKFKFTFLSLLVLNLAVISCGSNNFANKIIFATSQTKIFPLIFALDEIIPLYNEQQKNTNNFLPVELITSETNKFDREFDLLNGTIREIDANSNTIPSLILNSSTSAATINSYGKLLDVSDVLKPTDFAAGLRPLYTTIAGNNDHNRLYALPFDVSSTESLAINLPVLKFLVDQTIFNGAKLENTINDSTNQSQSIVAKLNKITSEKNKIKIAKTIWNRFQYNVKNPQNNSNLSINNSLNNYTITDKTFTNYDSLKDFSQKIIKILKPNSNVNVIKEDKYANIISVDYGYNIFNRRLWEKTGSNINSYVWSYKNNPSQKTTNVVDYTFLKENKDTNKAKQFIEAFNEFIKNNGTADTKNKLRGIYYTTRTRNGHNDWSAYLVRQFESAFAIAPNVGIRYSVQSDLTRKYFALDKNNNPSDAIFNSYGKYNEDVFWFNQYTSTEPKIENSMQNLQTYIAGGSSLVPISINSKKDAALKNFLKWLYKGEVILKNNTKVRVSEYLQEKSSYIIPLAETFGSKELVKKQIQKFEDKSKTAKTEDQYIYDSLALSSKDYLQLLEAQDALPYKDTNKHVLYNAAGDVNTSNLENQIDIIIQQLTATIPKNINGQQLFEKLVNDNKTIITSSNSK
ncbi:hypothetical protein MCAV_04230 [[Mycoplasma] cavipharyngis]|uniref:P68 family surface lipoprotein n=1 Tax=[Mycoplasma] cavipharyngis TaxID=92757 RepID=UPI003703F467